MGALLWVAKMLLKVMKPFLKIAIIEGLIEALTEFIANQEEPASEPEIESTTVIE